MVQLYGLYVVYVCVKQCVYVSACMCVFLARLNTIKYGFIAHTILDVSLIEIEKGFNVSHLHIQLIFCLEADILYTIVSAQRRIQSATFHNKYSLYNDFLSVFPDQERRK